MAWPPARPAPPLQATAKPCGEWRTCCASSAGGATPRAKTGSRTRPPSLPPRRATTQREPSLLAAGRCLAVPCESHIHAKNTITDQSILLLVLGFWESQKKHRYMRWRHAISPAVSGHYQSSGGIPSLKGHDSACNSIMSPRTCPRRLVLKQQSSTLVHLTRAARGGW